MSANPQAMAQMLAMQLGQQPQSAVQGQNSGLGAASQLAQKIMLMKALQGAPQQPGQPPLAQQVPPGQMLPQQMNQMPMPGGTNA